MSNEIAWMVQGRLRARKMTDEFQTLVKDMTDSTLEEAGTLVYEWAYESANNKIHLYERYRDSDAAVLHLQNFGRNFVTRFLGALYVDSVTVYGSPSAELKKLLDLQKAVVYERVGGFARS